MTYMGKENLRVLIGMSWPYANGQLHIGHIASSLPADCIARYWRDNNAEVSFVSGGDCFGTPILVASKQQGITPDEVAEKYYQTQVADYGDLLFSFDNYTKTMSPHHIEFVQKFHAEMYDGDKTFVRSVQQLYCPDCRQYLPDRYVEGTCPHCRKHAKGDSCDHCGKMLEPEELIDPKCKLCGATPKMRDTKQIYLKLSALQNDIQKNADSKSKEWTNNAVGMTGKYFGEGLIDRAITRNISWGVDLPETAKKILGDLTDKKIYIWAENVLGYMSATKECKQNWEEFLYDDTNTARPKSPQSTAEQVDTKAVSLNANDRTGQRSSTKLCEVNAAILHYYVHAKDNIPFHSIILPGLLLANGKHRWHLPDRIIASEYITLNGKKMSKSDGNYITARELIDRFDVDYIRYYFLRNVNDKKDANFAFSDFVNTINGELVDNFGNLVNRTLAFIKSKFNGVIPENAVQNEVANQIEAAAKTAGENIELGYCNRALQTIMELVAFGNKHFNDRQPWATLKTDRKNTQQTIAECVEIIKASCKLLKYFIPKSAEKVLSWLDGKTKLGEIEILYKKLDLKEIEKQKWNR
jgi:methionyl-tRNA synthetase